MKFWRQKLKEEVTLVDLYDLASKIFIEIQGETEGKEDECKEYYLTRKDLEKLTDMVLSVIHGGLSIHEYRWKLIRRYLYVYFKELFSK